MALQEMDAYRLCNEKKYFTHGDNSQYDRMFNMLSEGKPLHDIALVIWICSENVSLDDVETQLEELL